MQIINPIYDSAFKYLMDNNQVAKLVISAIIGEEVEELLLDATELKVDVPIENRKEKEEKDQSPFFTILRIDFAARIKTSDGNFKEVLIEIQKAKLSSDIMRFRRYLGENYANENVSMEINGIKKALPILPIYFLGHPLKHCKSSVLKINRQYTDGITGEIIDTREEFVESLTHNCFIIQIAQLKKRRRNDLEALLSIFDQDNKSNDKHILNIKEDDIPEKYRPVMRRLIEAISEPRVRQGMKAEDDVLNELQILERVIESERIQKEEAQAREKEALSREKEALSRENEALSREKEALSREKEAYSKIQSAITAMVAGKIGISVIANTFQLSVEEVQKIIQEHQSKT